MKRYIVATSSDWMTLGHTLSVKGVGDIDGVCYERDLDSRYSATIYPKYTEDYNSHIWELTIYDRIFPVESKMFDTVEEAKRYADTEMYNKYCR